MCADPDHYKDDPSTGYTELSLNSCGFVAYITARVHKGDTVTPAHTFTVTSRTEILEVHDDHVTLADPAQGRFMIPTSSHGSANEWV